MRRIIRIEMRLDELIATACKLTSTENLINPSMSIPYGGSDENVVAGDKGTVIVLQYEEIETN